MEVQRPHLFKCGFIEYCVICNISLVVMLYQLAGLQGFGWLVNALVTKNISDHL